MIFERNGQQSCTKATREVALGPRGAVVQMRIGLI